MHAVRVLMVLPDLRVSNGVARFAINYFHNINHDEIKIDFAVLSYSESPYIDEVKKMGSKVIVLPSLTKHPIKNLKNAKKILDDGKYDIVHVNTLSRALPVLLYARNRVSVRIMHSHSTRMGDSKVKGAVNMLLRPILMKLSNCYSACSINAGETLFGDRQFTIIPNLIDPAQFRHDEIVGMKIRNREKISRQKVIGTVGRLAEPKNPFFALEVMQIVLAQSDEIEYWWIGDGPLDGAVQQYVRDHKLSDRIRLFGSREDVSDLYQAMDLFFLPSRFEGFGMACIEAQAAGLPCVVSSEFSPEVDITGNVIFQDLNKKATEWASILLNNLGKSIDRDRAFKLCEESKYAQKNSGRMLTEYYYSCLSSKALTNKEWKES